ncbi:MAG: hypothetical protein V1746_00920 [bacterium]
MNWDSYLHICREHLDVLLMHPENMVGLGIVGGLAFLAMVSLLFQTQAYFGATRTTGPIATLVIIIIGSLPFFAAAAIRYYLPSLPPNLLPSLSQALNSLGVPWGQEGVENLFVWGGAVLVLLVIGCPLTSLIFHSGFFAALKSWIITLIGGAVAVYVAHLGIGFFQKSGSMHDVWKKSDKEWNQELDKNAPSNP